MMFWLCLLGLVIALALYLHNAYSRFSKYGVKYVTPVPILGTMWRILFRLDHVTEDIEKTYNNFPGERFVGKFEFMKPLLVLHDLDTIKRVTVKDFEHFIDHRVVVDKENDPLFGRSLISLKGQDWKEMRSTLSPAFTSSKIRFMIPFMLEVGEQMIKVLKEKVADSADGYVELEAKDLTTRYANDVIASCAFGLKVDSHTAQNNEFYKLGKDFLDVKFKQILVFIGYALVPKLMSIMKISLFNGSIKSFFTNLVMNTINERETGHIIRPDMIHLLMEAKKGRLSHDEKTDGGAGFATVEEFGVGKKDTKMTWCDDDIIAQAVLFFFAGFETVSTAMSFLLHELTLNTDVQERLYEEIKENDERNNGKFDYDSIQRMKYLDMVVSETIRLWPPGVALDRLCVKDYNMGKPNDNATQDYIIRKNEAVQIPVWAFHRNPEYFPNPERFDPERFSDENKQKIKPFTYVPFGLGPRNCIGSRFALCEVKVMVYQLLQSMELSPGPKTQIPSKLAKDTFSMKINGGFWFRCRPRK